MTGRARWLEGGMVLLLGMTAACTSLQRHPRLMAVHPDVDEMGGRPPVCTECHDTKDETFVWVQFNHTGEFGRQHKPQARQQNQVCGMCHQRDDCSNCHTTRVELKPSVRHPGRTGRRMPHRGAYLTRHRVDGRVNPTSCVRCHGNAKRSTSCLKCHG